MDNLLALKPGNSLWVPVLSGSMAPLYLPGEEVRITALGEKEIEAVIKPGTIAVFYEAGHFFFHRILRISRRKQQVYQKGDANREGSWTACKRIIGVVHEGRRKEGSHYSYFRDRSPGLFILTYYIIILRRLKQAVKKGLQRCLFMI